MERPGVALLPLRLFLGVTFVFAGLQKLADPRFLDGRSPQGLHAQLLNYARNSPVAGLLRASSHHAVLVGVAIALGELAVGLGALLGLWTRLAAAGGMALSASFLLGVSWHTRPYYLGPDVFSLFAWTPLVLLGAGGVLSLDAALAARAREWGAVDVTRRALVLQGTAAAVAAGAAIAGAGAIAGIGRLLGGTRDAGAGPVLAHGPARAPSPPTGAATAPSTAPPATRGVAIGPASAVPVGGAARFVDPRTGDPSIVLRPSADRFVAHSAVCTHAGCTVRYAGGELLVCPCHGAEFDGVSGQAMRGPARDALPAVAIERGPDGQLYVT